MKFFRKYIFPALYGLLVYFTVRLLHDTDIGFHFWKRDWRINAVELTCSILVGYLGITLFEWLFKFYDRRSPVQLSYKNVFKELAIFIGANLVLVNFVFVPMDTALHQAWIPWADIADINMIPTFYAVIYYGIARSNTYLRAFVNNKIQLEKITNDHLQTELKFLKSQYHPHFLFNALNTIYFQMDEDVEGAKQSIEKFSELLRYQLYDQQQQVPISSEMEYLKSFIDLQKIRSTDKLKLDLKFDKALNGQLVYPLLFLPLVENAFKFIGGDYEMKVSTEVESKEIVFKVENSVPDFQEKLNKTGGIGLENLKRRLDLLYPGKHSFMAQKLGDSFVAELRLNYE
ncbi:Histidine kinase [Mucilaginibacter mallensis]|uniref:Histidine kinase n=1 Tax=Mucilaginibacter mallensis TaxID=652787 RepID=A0A1H1SZ41_MUCMA|nr:histidine kinase [Mucilaginibacter mallensis]SDS52669.1 Histidine kinase [Mucilaginibacter mallensis]